MGMLLTFKSIGMGGGEMTAMMAKGISAALFPPEVGLCVALPGLVMVMMLKRKRHEYEAFLARLESFTVRRYKTARNDFDGDPDAEVMTRLAPKRTSHIGDVNLVPAAG
jgi:biopolymer transport protein ExbB/TolQ